MELTHLIKPLSPSVFTKRLPGKYVRCRVKRFVTRCQSDQSPTGACRRKLLIGTLLSFGLLQRESKADEAIDQGLGSAKTYSFTGDVPATVEKEVPAPGGLSSQPPPPPPAQVQLQIPDLPDLPEMSLDSPTTLSLFSIATSMGIGALAIGYKSKLEDVGKDAKELLGKAGRLQAKVKMLNTEVVDKNQYLHGARKTVTTQSKQIHLDRGEVSRLDNEFKDRLSGLSDYEGKATKLSLTLNAEKDAAAKRFGEAQGEIRNLETKLEESQGTLQQKGSELEYVQFDLTGKLRELDHARNSIQKLGHQVRSLEQILTDEQEKAETLEGAREAAVEDVKGLLSEQSHLTTALEKETGMVSKLKDALQEQRVEASELREKLDGFVSQSRYALTTLSSKTHEFNQLRMAHADLSAKESSLRDDLASMQHLLHQKSQDVKAAQSQCHTLERQILERGKEISVLEKELSSEKRAHSLSQSTMDALRKDLRISNENLAASKKQVEMMKQQTHSKTEGIQELKERFEKTKAELADVKKQLSFESHRARLLQAGLETKEREVQEANYKLKVQRERFDDLKAKTGQLDNLQKELHGAKQELSSKYYESLSMKKDLQRTKEEAQAANQQLEEQKEHYNALTAKANRLEGVEQALEGARRDGEAISKQLFAAEREIQDLRTTQSKLKDAESNLRAMKEEVSTFKGGDRSELRKVKMELTTSSDEIKKLQMVINRMQQEANLLKTELKNAEVSNSEKLKSTVVVGQPPRNGNSHVHQPMQGSQGKTSLLPSQELVSMLGEQEASRVVAKVREDAVRLVEQIENSANNSVAQARKANQSGTANRLQRSLLEATEQLSQRDDQIAELQDTIAKLKSMRGGE